MNESERKIIVYTCNWDAYSGLESAGLQGLSYSAQVYPVRVMCLGRLHPGLILRAFELGAAGVLMLGCPPGECHYGFGNTRAEEMIDQVHALASLLGIDRVRIRLASVAAGDGSDFVNQIRTFVELLTDERAGERKG
jgi:F420-non-reducing hydrogenase iron-sulfur subunit